MLVNSLTQTFLDVSSNMMISSVFSKDNSLYTINKICMVSFLVIFMFRVTQAKFISKIHLIRQQGSMQFLKLILLAIVKLVHYIAYLYNLISFSFLISDLASHTLKIVSFYREKADGFYLRSKFISLTTVVLIGFIYIWCTHFNLIEIFVVLLIEKFSLKLINYIKATSVIEHSVSDTLSFMLCIILTLFIALQEILIDHSHINESEESNFPLFALFIITILVFAFVKEINMIESRRTAIRNRFQSVLVFILFVISELIMAKRNMFKIQFTIPALAVIAFAELYNTRYVNDIEELVISQVQEKRDSQNKEKFSEFTLNNFIKHIKQNKDSRNLLIQLLVNFSFMFVELIYGFLSNSLGLISDSVHMLIDSSALAIGLYASFVARLEANQHFTFGYERVEILSGYINGVFLLFVVVEIMSESFERLMNPQKVLPGKMIAVSFLGLFINLLGLYFFHDHGHIHSEEKDEQLEVQECEEDEEEESHGHMHHHHGHDHNHNLSGVYLHILADALGSVACIISAAIIYQYEFYLADPITSIVISLLILMTTVQLLKDTTKILLLQLPLSGRRILHFIQNDLKSIPSISVVSLTMWQFAGKTLVFNGKFRLNDSSQNEIESSKQIKAVIQKHPKIRFLAIDYECDII